MENQKALVDAKTRAPASRVTRLQFLTKFRGEDDRDSGRNLSPSLRNNFYSLSVPEQMSALWLHNAVKFCKGAMRVCLYEWRALQVPAAYDLGADKLNVFAPSTYQYR